MDRPSLSVCVGQQVIDSRPTVTLIYPDHEHGSPTGHQALAYISHEKQLRRAGIEARHVLAAGLPAVTQAIDADTSDALVLMFDWKDPVEAVIDVLRRARANRPARALLFMDYYAPTATPHFGVLPHVDVYIKRQILRDLSTYQKDLVGGYVVTDYLHRHLGYDIQGWHFGSKPDPAHLHKLVLGWNLGVIPLYRRILSVSRFAPWRWRSRPYAINRRFALAPVNDREWYQQYRNFAAEKTAALEHRWPCTGVPRTTRRAYLWQLLRSRIVFSPFGWGELCFRDYEAVVCGALLVKPSVEHMETRPDIFIPHETYVPVRWDFSDLHEKIEHYLTHPDEAERIVAAARQKLAAYYAGGFVTDFTRILSHAFQPPHVIPLPRDNAPSPKAAAGTGN